MLGKLQFQDNRVSVKTYTNQTGFGCCEDELFDGSDTAVDVSTLIAANVKQITESVINHTPVTTARFSALTE